jgi:hypothetical protein
MRKHIWLLFAALIPVSLLLLLFRVPVPNPIPKGWTTTVLLLALMGLMWSNRPRRTSSETPKPK